MKKIMTLAIAAIMAISASAEIKKTEQFHTVKLDAPVHLVILKGPVYSVNMVSRNEQLPSAVSYTVKNDNLYVSARDMESLSQAERHVTVIVTAPTDVDYQIGKDMKAVPSKKHRK